MKRTKKLEATAYHEAGHDIVGWRLGLRLKSATIVPGDDYDGRVAFSYSTQAA